MSTTDAEKSTLSARTRYNLILCAWTTAVFTVIAAIGGYFVAASFDEVSPFWGSAQGIFIGVTISLSNSIIFTFYLEGPAGQWVKRLPFLAVIMIRSLVILVIVMTAVRLSPVLLPPLSNSGFSWFDIETSAAVILSCFAIFLFSLMVEINRLLGQGVLGNFVRGRYHQPREEDLTFLYIDVVGSTSIAERVGPTAFHAILDGFARDLSDVVLEHGGKIHKYVGDGIIITWPATNSASVLLAINCFFSFRQKIENRRAHYQNDLGYYPEFRGALHGGTVVVGEMGDMKREIVYLGDTVNTVARILSLAGDLKENFLSSTQMLENVMLPKELVARELGSTPLRGRELSVELTSLSLV